MQVGACWSLELARTCFICLLITVSNAVSSHLSQLIPLCIRHRLFAALIAIFTRALRDHQTPAALLLVAAAAAAAAEEAAGAAAPASEAGAAEPDALLQQRESLRLAYKLLVFLRCCLLGQAYPPGEGGAWRGAVLVFRLAW